MRRPKSAWAARRRIDELARTSGQRRADALVEMATRSRSAPAEGIRPAPLFSVFVGYETLHGRICELENGTVLPPALDPWMDSAYFERAIFSLGNRVDVSVRSRLFSGGTRRAIELRDRMCTHPHCYEPAESCQVDHIETYARAGPPPRRTGACSVASTTACATRKSSPGDAGPAPTTERRLRGRRGDAVRPQPAPRSTPAEPWPAFRKATAPRRFGAPGLRDLVAGACHQVTRVTSDSGSGL